MNRWAFIIASRAFPALGVALSAVFLVGCPREVVVPPLGEDAVPCATFVDCNTVTCGELRACADGYCEEGASLVVGCAP